MAKLRSAPAGARPGARLSDLNLPGRAHSIRGTDEDDNEVTVHLWLRKLSPDEHDTATRKGAAARARVLLAFADPDSDESMALWDRVNSWTDDTIIHLLTLDERRRHTEAVEAQLLGDEDSEWAKDDKLAALREAWADDPDDGTPGLARRYSEDPEDPEALRVLGELNRFLDIAQNRIDNLVQPFVDELEDMSRAQLVDRMLSHLQKSEASAAWILEYDAWQVALGTRLHDPTIPQGEPHPEHKVRYFESRQEVADTDEAIIDEILREFGRMVVDVSAGKDSRPAPTSSPPSESPAGPEGVLPSSLKAATG